MRLLQIPAPSYMFIRGRTTLLACLEGLINSIKVTRLLVFYSNMEIRSPAKKIKCEHSITLIDLDIVKVSHTLQSTLLNIITLN